MSISVSVGTVDKCFMKTKCDQNLSQMGMATQQQKRARFNICWAMFIRDAAVNGISFRYLRGETLFPLFSADIS
jgi:hypothetical protein